MANVIAFPPSFLAYILNSPLLKSMLDEFNNIPGATIVQSSNSGTFSQFVPGSTNNKRDNATIYLDLSLVSNMNSPSTWGALADALAHELGHMLLNDPTKPPPSAPTLGLAVQYGETYEGQAVTAEYIVDRQLQAQHQNVAINRLDPALLTQLDLDANANGLNYKTNSAALLSIVDTGALQSYNSGQYFNTAVPNAGKKYETHHPSSYPQLTYLDQWEDSWIGVNAYGLIVVSPSGNQIGIDLAKMGQTGKKFTVHGDDITGWTFSGLEIPLVAGSSLPLLTAPAVAGETITFDGSISRYGFTDQGDVTLRAGNSATIEGGFSHRNDVLKGFKGSDAFIIELPLDKQQPNVITLDLPRSVTGGSVSIADYGLVLGGSTSSPLLPEEPVGSLDRWSANGQSGGYQYTFDPRRRTMTISNTDSGGLGNNSIVITNFDLKAAESSTGFLGIFLQRGVTLKADADTLPENHADTIRVKLAGIALDGEKLHLATSDLGNNLYALTGAELLPFGNDGVDIALTEGQSEVIFSLVSQGDVDTDQNLTLSATLLDANGNASGAASTLNIAFDATDEAPRTNPVTTNTIDPTVPGSIEGRPIHYTADLNGTSANDLIYTHSNINGVGEQTVADEYGGDNVVMGSDGADQIFAGNGNDLVFGGGYIDFLHGDLPWDETSAGNDVLVGGAASDLIIGDGGNDELWATDLGDINSAVTLAESEVSVDQRGDVLLGDTGDDFLRGSSGWDILSGGDGEDTLIGGGGDDLLLGEQSYDVLFDIPFPVIDSGDFDWGWSIVRTPVTTPNGYTTYNISISDTSPYSSFTSVPVSDTDGGADTIYGGAGNDFIFAGVGNDFADGGSGDDQISGEKGDDTLLGVQETICLWVVASMTSVAPIS